MCVTIDGTVTTTKVLDRIGKQQNEEHTVEKNAVNMYIKEPATTTEEHGDDVPTSNSDCYLSKQAIDSRETNEIIETINIRKDARMGEGGQSFVEVTRQGTVKHTMCVLLRQRTEECVDERTVYYFASIGLLSSYKVWVTSVDVS